MRLKAPYGIWNEEMKRITGEYEYGLKAPYGIWNWEFSAGEEEVCEGLKAPYGIWNKRLLATLKDRSGVWKLPMGFETKKFYICSKEKIWFESSLWDLKHLYISTHSAWEENCLKAPYGIWNFMTLSILSSFGLVWKLPMGFETKSFVDCCCIFCVFESSLWDLKLWRWCWRRIVIACLKAPYGIWNYTCYTQKTQGNAFESSLWDLKHWSVNFNTLNWCVFESSLWDLKLINFYGVTTNV